MPLAMLPVRRQIWSRLPDQPSQQTGFIGPRPIRNASSLDFRPAVAARSLPRSHIPNAA